MRDRLGSSPTVTMEVPAVAISPSKAEPLARAVGASKWPPTSKRARIMLLFPPGGDPALPCGSTPLLAARLAQAGNQSVIQRDINLEAFDDLLTVENLERSIERACDRRQPRAMAGSEYLEWLLKQSNEIVANIDEARGILRTPSRFYDIHQLLFAKRVFQLAGQLATAFSSSVQFGKYSYSNASYNSFDEICKAVSADETDGILTDYFKNCTVPSILAVHPSLVGISVTYFSQLIPAFVLARCLKDERPDLHITLGGVVPTWGQHILGRDHRFGRFLDSVLLGEADDSIVSLTAAVTEGRSTKSIAGIIAYCPESVHITEPGPPVDLDSLPSPDFSSLPLNRYFAPHRVLCLAPTRGCYFNRCTFCNYAFIKLAPYRARAARRVAEDIANIVKSTGETNFCLESDVTTPQYLSSLADEFVSAKLPIAWHSVSRFEHGLDEPLLRKLRRSGCVRLYFGLESASTRVLQVMDKGTTPERISRILRFCSAADIAVEAGVFCNFPSESGREAEETYDFVVQHYEHLSRCDVGEFRLLRGSPVAQDPARFGIEIESSADSYWYHLPFQDKNLKRDITHKRVAEDLQRLYPEVAFIDVPEDLLYTVRHGRNAVRRMIGAQSSVGPVSELATAEGEFQVRGCLSISSVYVSNAGSIVLSPNFEKSRRCFAPFDQSTLSFSVAVDTESHKCFMLTPLEAEALQSIAQRNQSEEAMPGADQQARSKTPERVAALHGLLAAGLICLQHQLEVRGERPIGEMP